MSINTNKASLAGIIISLGIVFGDLGTSPLYVFQAITHGGKHIDHGLIMGGLSSVIWTLILLTTIKYIYFALNADNKGEGGIFAIYALLKSKNRKWIIIPTLIGCAALLSDGFITPAISISSAVEGINNINPDLPVLPIIITIIIALFSIQQFGTNTIGKMFGPIMMIWFLYLGYLGIINISKNTEVLHAINPYYIYNMIVNVEGGFWVLGAVFLCTTGAEALYSDLGHCGKQNIRWSWSFVGLLLITNYFGQAANVLSDGFQLQPKETIFYALVPDNQIYFAIGIATAAAIIASQALITGVFTLMNEASKLNLWTNLKVKYPTDHQGQIFIPFINWVLFAGCILVIAVFRESSAMESTYGLAITIDMVVTSILLYYLLVTRNRKAKAFYILIFGIFIIIEGIFLMSNLGKIFSGGWFTLIIAISIFTLLYLYYRARMLRKRITEYIPMKNVIPLLEKVRNDKNIPFEATNLVYPTRSNNPNKLDSTVFHSLFKKRPRRAGVVWFLHLDILGDPWGIHYTVNEVIDGHCYFVNIQLGFKEEHRMEYAIRKIQKKMIEKGELSGESVFDCVKGEFDESDFKFIVINTRIAMDNKLTPFQTICVKAYRFVKSIGLKAAEDFGLDKTNVQSEFIPISVTKQGNWELIEDYEDYSAENKVKLEKSIEGKNPRHQE